MVRPPAEIVATKPSSLSAYQGQRRQTPSSVLFATGLCTPRLLLRTTPPGAPAPRSPESHYTATPVSPIRVPAIPARRASILYILSHRDAPT